MGERIAPDVAQRLVNGATTAHPGVNASGSDRGGVIMVPRPSDALRVCSECGEYAHSRAPITCTAARASISMRAGIKALESAAPDLAHTVVLQAADIAARDATIAELRAQLGAARVGVVTVEEHARAVREAWGPSDPLEWDDRDRRWWLSDKSRTGLLATLRAAGLSDADAVALADGGGE